MSPELRITAYVVYAVSLFIFPHLVYYALLCSVIVCLFLFLPSRVLKAGWIPISIFTIFTFLGNLLEHPGRVLFSAGPAIITTDGLHYAAVRSFRFILMIGGVKVLMTWTSSGAVVSAMYRLLRPLERTGMPVGEFFHIMGLTMRCFPILQDRISAQYNKTAAQGTRKSLIERVRFAAAFLLPFFVESIRSPDSFFGSTEGVQNDV